MFTSSDPFLVFDYLRVPYTVDDVSVRAATRDVGLERWGRLLSAQRPNGPCLFWPVFRDGEPAQPGALPPQRLRLRHMVLHGRVVPDGVVGIGLDASSEGWQPVEGVFGEGGERLGSLWRSRTGSMVLPFDPDELITSFWSERYADLTAGTTRGRLTARARSGYYLLRPLLPRSAQIALRRAYSRVQRRSTFPRWPVETSLHDFLDLSLQWASSLADARVPWIAPWPHGHSWALVLTHDVETARGLDGIPQLRGVECRAGYRSSWNFVSGRYHVDEDLVQRLWDSGCEVGVHGLHHDGHDLDPRELPLRLPEMRRYADAWGAVGFRSPATQRNWTTMSSLPFQYDSSYPDSDPFEPQAGGCCSWLPFLNGALVELPITLPQDHTLFVILRAVDGSLWLDKAEEIKSRGGLALVLTHPDYVADGPVMAAYQQLLEHFADDPEMWQVLPGVAADWWRRRAASQVVPAGDAWQVAGPAADDAAVVFTEPSDEQTWEARVE